MIKAPKIRIDKTHFFYVFAIFILFGVFIILAVLNVTVKKQISQINLLILPTSFSTSDYPKVNNKYEPLISAQGAVVIDKVSHVPLYEKNSTLRFPPASTTKIMTALVALDYYKDNDLLVIKNPNVEGSDMGFFKDEKFTFKNLLYAMLLPSSNEAAQAIADNYPGGENAFVGKMNEKANELHLDNTYYADPIGIEDQKDYSTPLDMARLSAIALENPEFSSIVSTKNINIRNSQGKNYPLYNLNKLLNIPGVNGIKTGHTEGAGDVLVTSRTIGSGEQLIFVIMQSQDRFTDTQALINYLNDNITYQSVHP